MLGAHPFNPSEKGFVTVGLLRLADAAAVVASAILAYWLREGTLAAPPRYVVAVVIAVLLLLNGAQLTGLYDFKGLARFAGQFGRLSLVWVAVFLFLTALAYFTKTAETFSRLWAGGWFVAGYIALVAARVIAVRRIEAWRAEGQLARRIAVVGEGRKAARLMRLIREADARDVAFEGVYAEDGGVGGEVDGVPLAGGLDDLIETVKDDRVDEIIVASDDDSPANLARIMKALATVSIDVKLAPDTIDLPFPALGIDQLRGVPLLAVHRRPLTVWSRIVKRGEDLVIGTLGLIVAAPVMALIAVLIKLTSPGPVLFRQRRLGFNGNAFTVYKFRTMRTEGAPSDTGGAVPQATRDDPRVTRCGAFLRRTSLDELPQLINVLAGQMSLVGPRPHAVAHNVEYAALIDGYLGRHRVKPGITGWAQVNGYRGETDTPEKMRRRVEHDLYYIDHWSLWFDLKILLLTVVFGFFSRNAY